MAEWTASPDRVCGFGENGTVTLEVVDWRHGGEAPGLPASAGAAVTGSAEAVDLPAGEDGNAPDVTELSDEAGPRPLATGRLDGGVHVLVVDSTPEVHLAFEGPATVERAGGTSIRFPERTGMTVGFREALPPRSTVEVPPTPAGLATAVTAAARTPRTTGPERSHPGYRPRTPAVAFDPGASVATGTIDGGERLDDRSRSPRTTLTVPDTTVAVLVAAPLAYYLGAALRIEAGPPTLRAPGFTHEFGRLPAFADEVADAVRGLVALDERLRSVPGERGPAGADPDRQALATAPPADRLASVLESPPASLPTWPLTTYVNDDALNGRYLPFLLDRLSLVYPARSSSLDPQALLKRSLDEFYRGESPNVEAVDPSLADGRYHAWLGDGTPVDAFTLLGASPQGTAGPSGTPGTAEPAERPSAGREALRVDVVCNEPAMAAERDVAGVYRSRLDVRDVDVVVHERLSTAELADVFERPTDLVHFIGHCEVDGIRCRDGTLAAGDLETCRARTFFLNACGSYYEGYDLVRRGATVGAVTLTAVLDDQAVTVGTTFAELLAAGFAFDRALSIARGEIIVGRDYAVVGDGTHRLRSPPATPAMCHLESVGGAFELRYDPLEPDAAGRRYLDPFDGRHRSCGEPAAATLDRAELCAFLERFSLPVRFEGTLRWSDDLACSLRDHEQQN